MLVEELSKLLKNMGGFDDLKLAGSVFNAQKRTLSLRFVTTEKLSEQSKKTVSDAVGELIKSKLSGEIKLTCSFDKDFFDADAARIAFIKYFEENLQSLLPLVSDNAEAAENEDGSIEIKFTVNNENFLLFKQMDVVSKCNKYFESITNRKVTVKTDVVKANTDKKELREWAMQKQESQITKAAFRPQRTINVEDVAEYIGGRISERPKYIIDALEREGKYVTVCGKVQSPGLRITPTGFKLFKFDLADHTAKISVVMFPNDDSAMLKKLQALEQNDEVLLNGSTAISNYSHNMEFKAYRVAKCRVNEPEWLAQKTREVPANYVNVKEEDCAPARQFTLFAEKEVPPQLKDKTFVVFDFETTGKEYLRDKVIEIGAVKIESGTITKKFSSFVNPERDIPREITELTGIINKDVENAPVFEEIIADFYKFAYGSTLVAHSIDFDLAFLHFNTKDSGYIFSQRQIDTVSLARSFFSLPQNKDNRPVDHKLSTLAAHMGVDSQNAHRAINDALMTAEIFLKIMAVYEG